MAHELMIRNGQAAFVSARVPGWHALGNVIDADALTAREALVGGDLDWNVSLEPLYVRNPGTGELIEVPDRRGVVRDDDYQTLGVVGSKYMPFQNWEAFDFIDHLVDSSEAKFQTAGALFGGKQVFLTAKVGDTVKIAGFDEYETYLFLITSHDGSKAVTVLPTMIRVVCNNTSQMALNSARAVWTHPHRESLTGKIADAQETLGLTYKYQETFAEEVEMLLNTETTDARFEEIIAATYPKQKLQLEKNVRGIIQNRHTSPTIDDELRGTAFGAYNAFTEYVEHLRTYRTQEARLKSIQIGWGADFRTKIARGLLAGTAA